MPPELGSLASLIELKARNNQPSGAWPPELGSLGKLTELLLAAVQTCETLQYVTEELCADREVVHDIGKQM